MGVDVDSVIFVGKRVDDPEKYLIEKGIISEEDFAEFNEDWREHNLNTELEVHEISGYSDRGYYIGFEVGYGDPKAISELILEYAEKFEQITKEKPRFEHWAYYW